MNDLLETAVTAHGGLQRWREITAITLEASISGAFWGFKNQRDALRHVRVEVDTTQQRLVMDFVGLDKRTVFNASRVELQHADGGLVEGRDDPEGSFVGHEFETPWDDLHLAYFTGETLWTYLNSPFVLAGPGFRAEEIAPIEVGGEGWRRLRVTFPDHIKTHTREQIFCFGPDGLLRRHDFTIDVLGGAPGQLYASEYRDVDGIVIPTTRRAWQGDDHRPETLMIAIDMSDISVA
jgi:hypothetical protein